MNPLPPPSTWLLRWPEVFADWRDERLGHWGIRVIREIGRDYLLVQADGAEALGRDPAAIKWLGWSLPMHHVWPCRPAQIQGFVEKAATALSRKFAALPLQGLWVGALDPGDRAGRQLASNLRGRALQLFGPELAACHSAEDQAPDQPSLFVLLGQEGLFAGVSSPRAAGGFYPGGTRFIRQTGQGVISRAGAKVAEALHHWRLHGPVPGPQAHWLELGASPGGMTAELLTRGWRVTAVDRAPLDPRLEGAAGLDFAAADVAEFEPPADAAYDAILCDMNGTAMTAFDQVQRLSRWLKPGGLVVFTLKLTGVADGAAADALEAAIRGRAARDGLDVVACRHLTYNRREFTCWLQRRQAGPL